MKSRRVNALIVILVLATSIFCNCVSALDCETRTESYDSAYELLNTDISVSLRTTVAIGAYKTVSCGSMYVSSYVTLSIKSNMRIGLTQLGLISCKKNKFPSHFRATNSFEISQN